MSMAGFALLLWSWSTPQPLQCPQTPHASILLLQQNILHNGHIASPEQFYTLLVAISSLLPPSSSLSSIQATLPAYGPLLECSVCRLPSATSSAHFLGCHGC